MSGRVLVYFGVLALVPVYLAWSGNGPSGIPVAAQAVWLLVLGGLLVGITSLLALLTVRTTIYAGHRSQGHLPHSGSHCRR